MFAARAALMTGKKDTALKGSVALTTSSHISTTSGTAFALGSSNWTIEMWYYRTSNPGNEYLFDLANNGTRIQIYQNLIYFAAEGSGGYINTTSGLTLNTWNHIAMTKSTASGGVFGWVNGNYVGFVGNTANLTETSCTIGGYGGGAGIGLNGYISNFRIVKGTGVYTTNFTPSASALTAVSGTSILTAQDPNVIKDNGPNAFTMTVTGSAAASSQSPFA